MIAYHVDYLRVYCFSDDSALSGDIFQHLMKCLSLDLLALKLGTRVIKVEQNAALIQFLNKQLWSFAGRSL